MAFITTTANSISSGGTISGDITIEGDLTVNGDGAGAYDEIVDGNLRVSSTNKLEFGDTGTYIHQSADGVLDLVSDTELELNATTIDINGAVEISGNTGIGNTPEVNFHIKLADTANARIEDTSSDGIAKLDFKNDVRTATIGVYGDDSDNFKIDHGGGAVLIINTAQNVGIGTASPVAKMDIVGTRTLNLTNTISDDTDKNAVITHSHYNSGTETEGFLMMQGFSNSSLNRIDLGGGNSQHNAVEEIRFFTAANATTATGTERMAIDNSGDLQLQERLTFSGTNDTTATATINLHSNNYLYVTGGTTGLALTAEGGSDAIKITDGGGTGAISFEVGNTQRFKLDSNSRISLSNNDSGTSNTIYGKNAGASLDDGSNYNTFIGENVSDATMANAIANVGVGWSALSSITSGAQNSCLGTQAGQAITTGTGNIAIGNQTLYTATTVNSVVSIGGDSMRNIPAGQAITGITAVGFGSFKGGSSTTTGANYTTAIGHQALFDLTTGGSNVAVGALCAENITTGAENTALGTSAMRNSTTGSNNTALGRQAMGSGITTGDNNVAVGNNAGLDITSANNNTILGYSAGANLTDNADNVIVGYEAFFTANSGENENIVIGKHAGYYIDNAGADENIIIGKGAGQGGSGDLSGCVVIGANALDATGSNDLTGTIAIGHQALTALTSGVGNTAVGFESLKTTDDGALNTAVGYQALNANCGNGNVALGYKAGFGVTGALNILIGHQAGVDTVQLTSGTQNIVIGDNARTSASDSTNQVVIGRDATGQADNSVTLGNASVTAVYMAQDSGATVYANGLAIGQPSPTVPVHIKEDTSVDDAQLKVEQDGSGDAGIAFLLTGVKGYAMGIDNSHANDALIIGGNDDAIGTTPYLTINPSDSTVTGNLVDTSDIAFKENVQTLADGIGVVSKLNPVSFDWKDEGKGSNSGFIAQEIEKILPNDVSGEDYDAETSVNGKAINVTGIVAHLVKAVQELTAKVEALEKKG